MIPTKHEGLYYRKNKRNKKVFYARFKVNKKAYLKKLGEEPGMSTTTANIARAEMIAKFKGSKDYGSKDLNTFLEEYADSRKAALSESWYYNLNKNYNLHLRDEIGSRLPGQVRSNEVQKIINNMLIGDNKKNKEYEPSTVKQIKDCMTGLYRYIQKSGVSVENIGKDLVIPKFDNKVYFTLSDEKAQDLFDAILNYDNLKWRAYFIWLLHGRRKMETAQMKWEDIHFDSMTYVVPEKIAKVKKDVIAPITELLKKALVNYGVKKEGYIFMGNGLGKNEYVSESGVDSQWKNIRALAGLPKMRLHDIRHLIGFMGINSGYSLEKIGSVLGHSSTATTKRYSTMKSDSAKEVLSSMFDRFVR